MKALLTLSGIILIYALVAFIFGEWNAMLWPVWLRALYGLLAVGTVAHNYPIWYQRKA